MLSSLSRACPDVHFGGCIKAYCHAWSSGVQLHRCSISEAAALPLATQKLLKEISCSIASLIRCRVCKLWCTCSHYYLQCLSAYENISYAVDRFSCCERLVASLTVTEAIIMTFCPRFSCMQDTMGQISLRLSLRCGACDRSCSVTKALPPIGARPLQAQV